ALQEVRHKRGIVSGGQVTEHFAKRQHVIVPRVIGQLNPCDYNAHSRISRLHLINDLLKIGLNLIDRQAAEGIVDPEFENEDIDSVLQMRRKPLQAAFGGAAGRAGVDDLKIKIGSAQLLRKQRRIRFAAFKHKAVGQTIAEDKDAFRVGSIERLEGQGRQEDAKKHDATCHNETLKRCHTVILSEAKNL